LEPGEAVSISESVTANKNLVSQSVERTIMVVECYRMNGRSTHEVLVRLAYNSELIKEEAKRAMRKDLEDKGRNLHNQLDKLLGL
jgi:hypothetical protein